MKQRMMNSGFDGFLTALIYTGAGVGIGSAKQIVQNPKATTQQKIQVANDVINSGKVDVDGIKRIAVQATKEKIANEIKKVEERSNKQNLVDVINENVNNTVDNISYLRYNNLESDGGINEQLQSRGILEGFHSGIYENKTLSQRKYSRREYENWERTIKPIEQIKLTSEQQETINNIKRQYNKDIVFFDGNENNLYSGGASFTNPNRINIDINKAKVFGESRMIFHEIAESDILHHKELSNEFLKPAIEKIMSDPNFQNQKEIFWANEDGNIPNEYLIAKDILCDAYSEIKTGENLDYKNVLSNETNMTIKYALDNFYKQLTNSQNNVQNDTGNRINSSIDNFTNTNDKTSQNRFSTQTNEIKLPTKEYFEKKVNSFNGYTNNEISNIKSNKIFIANNVADITKFVENSQRIPGNFKMYVGKIKQTIASKIKNSFGIDVNNYNISLKTDAIRHSFKEHGNKLTENNRGQLPITINDFSNIPDIINYPDNVSNEGLNGDGKPVIKFEKNIDGNTVVVTYVSDKHNTLELQTMYKFKNNKNIDSVNATNELNPLVRTSKTNIDTSLSNNSISRNNKNINTNSTFTNNLNLINKFNEMEASKNTYEKVARKENLSEKDKLQVERLLNEEIDFSELPKNSNKSGILNVYNAKKPYNNLKKYVDSYKKQLNSNRIETAKKLIENIDSWKDKKSGLLYNRARFWDF